MKYLNQAKEIEELRQQNLYLKKVSDDAMAALQNYHSMMANFIERTESILAMGIEKTGKSD